MLRRLDGQEFVETFVQYGNRYYQLWEQKKAPSITARQQAFFATIKAAGSHPPPAG